ncbi:MAG: cryptochrome/photolyase family protein [Actinomycetota bacterium]
MTTPSDDRPTIWLLGDQLNRHVGPLADRTPGDCRVLLVESRAKLTSKRWHLQRAHLVLSAMEHLAAELRNEGFDVDHRLADSLADGLADHRRQHRLPEVIAMSPMSWDGRALLERHGVTTVPNTQFLCSPDEFAGWADGRNRLVMEDFYRWQRRRLDVLIEPDGEPAGGRWNYDDENREPPPKDGRAWPPLTPFALDEIDTAVLDRLRGDDGVGDGDGSVGDGVETWGHPPDGWWPVTRAQALARLDEFIEHGLPVFGPHEDAMLADEAKLAHSTLSPALNLGLLHPAEVVEAAADAYRAGRVPINSAEGFIRQVMGWREYVWGLYWLWMPEYRHENGLDATRAVPPAFTGDAPTEMRCVGSVIDRLDRHGWTHHIERLMVLGNLALTTGVDPLAMTDWMWANFVDGAEWVMLPNVIGMALHADGGRMATKPYASGGAYINRMSDFCKGCRFDPKKRTGDTACPFTSLYWDFLARNRETLSGNHRLSRQLANLDRLKDLDETRERAGAVLTMLDTGKL